MCAAKFSGLRVFHRCEIAATTKTRSLSYVKVRAAVGCELGRGSLVTPCMLSSTQGHAPWGNLLLSPALRPQATSRRTGARTHRTSGTRRQPPEFPKISIAQTEIQILRTQKKKSQKKKSKITIIDYSGSEPSRPQSPLRASIFL